MAEQYVQQQLRAINNRELFYWSSPQSDAEIDFAFAAGEAFVPLEVKAEINLRAKSLLTFCRKQQVRLAIRTSLAPYSVNDVPTANPDETFKLIDLPLFAIEDAFQVCEQMQSNTSE